MKSLKLIIAMSFVVVSLVCLVTLPNQVSGSQAITDAPTTTLSQLNDDLHNGFGAKGSPIDECAGEPVPLRSFEDNKFIFNELETVEDGLGPVFNAPGCGDCHGHPVIGGISQMRELRAGNFANGVFTEPPGNQNRSLIQLRAITAGLTETLNVIAAQNVRTFRTTLNVIGDGFIEAIDSNALNANRLNQPAGFVGTLIQVPVVEAGGALRAGRFGWKNQHASLHSFSGDAYLNEMGITNPFQGGPIVENDSLGRSVAAADTVEEPEDEGEDVEAFAQFMRQTRAPGRGPITAAAARGETLFSQIGCAICHTPSFTTVPPGTSINQGAFIVPAALGNKRIRAFSDFLLHDIGTGDGIVQNGGAGTRNMVRTPPLWGVRTHPELMHDGLSFTFNEAIQRHAGVGGTFTRNNFNALSAAQRADVIAFLNSL
jgi:CxxC motif-containing protein (DUF1111 family)